MRIRMVHGAQQKLETFKVLIFAWAGCTLSQELNEVSVLLS